METTSSYEKIPMRISNCEYFDWLIKIIFVALILQILDFIQMNDANSQQKLLDSSGKSAKTLGLIDSKLKTGVNSHLKQNCLSYRSIGLSINTKIIRKDFFPCTTASHYTAWITSTQSKVG